MLIRIAALPPKRNKSLLDIPKAKAFGTGVWGTTFLQKGFPQQLMHKALSQQALFKSTEVREVIKKGAFGLYAK